MADSSESNNGKGYTVASVRAPEKGYFQDDVDPLKDVNPIVMKSVDDVIQAIRESYRKFIESQSAYLEDGGTASSEDGSMTESDEETVSTATTSEDRSDEIISAIDTVSDGVERNSESLNEIRGMIGVESRPSEKFESVEDESEADESETESGENVIDTIHSAEERLSDELSESNEDIRKLVSGLGTKTDETPSAAQKVAGSAKREEESEKKTAPKPVVYDDIFQMLLDGESLNRSVREQMEADEEDSEVADGTEFVETLRRIDGTVQSIYERIDIVSKRDADESAVDEAPIGTAKGQNGSVFDGMNPMATFLTGMAGGGFLTSMIGMLFGNPATMLMLAGGLGAALIPMFDKITDRFAPMVSELKDSIAQSIPEILERKAPDMASAAVREFLAKAEEQGLDLGEMSSALASVADAIPTLSQIPFGEVAEVLKGIDRKSIDAVLEYVKSEDGRSALESLGKVVDSVSEMPFDELNEMVGLLNGEGNFSVESISEVIDCINAIDMERLRQISEFVTSDEFGDAMEAIGNVTSGSSIDFEGLKTLAESLQSVDFASIGSVLGNFDVDKIRSGIDLVKEGFGNEFDEIKEMVGTVNVMFEDGRRVLNSVAEVLDGYDEFIRGIPIVGRKYEERTRKSRDGLRRLLSETEETEQPTELISGVKQQTFSIRHGRETAASAQTNESVGRENLSRGTDFRSEIDLSGVERAIAESGNRIMEKLDGLSGRIDGLGQSDGTRMESTNSVIIRDKESFEVERIG